MFNGRRKFKYNYENIAKFLRVIKVRSIRNYIIFQLKVAILSQTYRLDRERYKKEEKKIKRKS